jgi:hypothetical protein
MVDDLAAVLHLKKHLRDAAARLAQEAETTPNDEFASGYLRLVMQCQQLEREIDLVAKLVLSMEEPRGIA